ncbi:MAG: vanadium-dependent haloperoxidase [Bacteroidota bacterium]
MKKTICMAALAAVLLMADSCQKHNPSDPPGHIPDGQVAFDWYRLQLRFLLERNTTMNGVYFSYLGIGLYESVRNAVAGARSLSGYLYQMPAMPMPEKNKSYDWEISANATMAAMLRSLNTGLTPADMTSIDSLENAWNQKIHLQINDGQFTRSQAYGKSIATAIYRWSQTDKFNPSNAGFVIAAFPGAWEPTPPAFVNPPLNPFIAEARPLLQADMNIVAPPPAAAYSEDKASAFYGIVKNVYDVSFTLTTEQKNIALFWVDQGNGLGYTPDGHNQLVVIEALEQAGANLGIAAEGFAKTGIAERESNIICYRGKYKYDLLRPVTYIRRFIDAQWSPFIVTPPFPEYPAAHAYVTGAVMQSLSYVLSDNFRVTDHAYDFRGWAPRTYNSLFAVAEEAGISRLYGGIHYLTSIDAGLSLSKDLGNSIGKIKLYDGNTYNLHSEQ